MNVDATLHGCPLYDTEQLPLVAWIAHYTGSCVYGNRAAISWSLGVISLVAWLGAQMPQIIANHRNRSVEGLSLAFLINWFLGDFTNLIGCLLTHQLPFQTLLAMYYVCVDLILSGQYYFYTRPHRKHNREAYLKRKKSHRHNRTLGKGNVSTTVIEAGEETSNSEPLSIPFKGRAVSFSIKSLVTSSFLASFTKVRSMPINVDDNSISTPASALLQASSIVLVTSIDSQMIGSIFSWLCASLYLTSRLPQIYKNFQRKSTSGTSILLFMAALTGNTTYTLSILLSPEANGPNGRSFLLNAFPFLLGAAGTVMFDLTIFVQWYMYKSDNDDNFMPTTPHYHHTPRTTHTNQFHYDILGNDDISDNDLDDEDLEIARAAAVAESSDVKQTPLRSAPSIPLMPTHQDEDTPLSKSPQSIYSSLWETWANMENQGYWLLFIFYYPT